MTIKDLKKWCNKMPAMAKVVLLISDDEGLVYSDLMLGGFQTTPKGMYACLIEDPRNKELQG